MRAVAVRCRRKAPWAGVAAILLALGSGISSAQTPPEVPPTAPEVSAPEPTPTPAPLEAAKPVAEGPDSIASHLADSEKEQRRELLKPLVGPWLKLNDFLDAKIGLSLGAAYATLGQVATDAPSGSSSAGGGILDILGKMKLWGQKGANPGQFGFALRYRHQIGGAVPLDLDQSIGSVTNTSASFGTGNKMEVKQAYLDQVLFSSRVLVRVGRFFPDDLFDAYSLKSTRRFFLNSTFSDNPAVAFPDSGTGAMFQVTPLKDVHVMFGATDTTGRKLEDTGIRPQENVFGASELVWSPDFGPFGKPVNRLMYWHTNSTDESVTPNGNGVAYTFEQQFTSGVTVFVRFAYSATAATSVQTLFSAGGGVDHPFGRSNAYAGVAVAVARPSGGSTRNEKVAEAFYRLRVTSYIEVTGDIQVIFDPASNPSTSAIGVFGARGRVSF